MLIHLNDVKGALCADGLEVDSLPFVGGIGHQSGEDVGFEIVVVGIGRLQDNFSVGQPPRGFHVVVDFVVQTTLQLGTHSCQLLRV